MVEVLEAEPAFENRVPRAPYYTTAPLAPQDHIPTLFETKFMKRGKTIHYLYYRKR